MRLAAQGDEPRAVEPPAHDRTPATRTIAAPGFEGAIGQGERFAGLVLLAEPPAGHRQDRRLEVIGGALRRQEIEGLAIAPGAIVRQAQRDLSPRLGRIDGDAPSGELDETIGADQFVGHHAQRHGDVVGIRSDRAVQVGQPGRGAEIAVAIAQRGQELDLPRLAPGMEELTAAVGSIELVRGLRPSAEFGEEVRAIQLEVVGADAQVDGRPSAMAHSGRAAYSARRGA